MPNRRTPEIFGATFEEIEFNSSDGTPLSGWFIPADNASKIIVLTHGMCANRSQMLPWAEWLWKAGYSLLLFDFRALGESGGQLCSMGLYEPNDILAAVDYLATQHETAAFPVGVFGFSMGGVSAIIAAAQDERIKIVISHGAYADLDRAIQQRCRKHFGPFAPIVETISRRLGARRFPAPSSTISALARVGEIAPRPLMITNGALDNIVLVKNAEDMHAAAAGSQLIVLQHSGHAYPADRDEPGYRESILQFLREGF